MIFEESAEYRDKLELSTVACQCCCACVQELIQVLILFFNNFSEERDLDTGTNQNSLLLRANVAARPGAQKNH